MKQNYYLSQERPNHNLGRFSPGITGGFPRQEKFDYGNDIQSKCYSNIYNIQDDLTVIESTLKAKRSAIPIKEDRLSRQATETFLGQKKFYDKNLKQQVVLPNRRPKEVSIKDADNQLELKFYSPEEIHKHIRKRKLTSKELKKAMSIIGIVKEGLEEDLSERFREYLYSE